MISINFEPNGGLIPGILVLKAVNPYFHFSIGINEYSNQEGRKTRLQTNDGTDP